MLEKGNLTFMHKLNVIKLEIACVIYSLKKERWKVYHVVLHGCETDSRVAGNEGLMVVFN